MSDVGQSGLFADNAKKLEIDLSLVEELVISHHHDGYGGGICLIMRREGKLMPDSFGHELVTVLEGDEQLVVLTGCAHNGVLNMIAATREVFPEKLIKAVIGGFHLSHEEDSRVVEVGEALAVLELSAVYTGHCTGDRQTGILQSVLGDRLHWLHTGLVIEFLNTVN